MRFAAVLALCAALAALPVRADPDPADWDSVLAEARGQTVWFHAWGGSAQANDFIAWAGARVATDVGGTVKRSISSGSTAPTSRR